MIYFNTAPISQFSLYMLTNSEQQSSCLCYFHFILQVSATMEVGGKKPDKDLPNSSDQWVPDCHPCSTDGEQNPAEGYCQTCRDYLCMTCYKSHIIPKQLRHHVLLDKTKMPNTTSYMLSTLDFKTANVTLLPNIDFCSPGDKKQPCISGLTFLHPDTLLAVDCTNNTLKAVSTTTNSITSQLPLTSRPWDITLLQGDQAAVTLPREKKIQLISTKGPLSSVRFISVRGECRGICSLDSDLVVTYISAGQIEIMDIKGTIINTITTDNNGKSMFSDPHYITVVREKSGEMIYVSDWDTRSITKLSVKGEVLSTYNHKNRSRINGLTCVGEGQVLVCNFGEDTVDVVSDDGQDIVTLLDSTHGIERPQALCYCPAQAALYVSSSIDGRPVSVFKLSKK